MVRGYLFTNSVLDALEIEQRYLQANLLNDNITFILLLKLLSIYILSKNYLSNHSKDLYKVSTLFSLYCHYLFHKYCIISCNRKLKKKVLDWILNSTLFVVCKVFSLRVKAISSIFAPWLELIWLHRRQSRYKSIS